MIYKHFHTIRAPLLPDTCEARMHACMHSSRQVYRQAIAVTTSLCNCIGVPGKRYRQL